MTKEQKEYLDRAALFELSDAITDERKAELEKRFHLTRDEFLNMVAPHGCSNPSVITIGDYIADKARSVITFSYDICQYDINLTHLQDTMDWALTYLTNHFIALCTANCNNSSEILFIYSIIIQQTAWDIAPSEIINYHKEAFIDSLILAHKKVFTKERMMTIISDIEHNMESNHMAIGWGKGEISPIDIANIKFNVIDQGGEWITSYWKF